MSTAEVSPDVRSWPLASASIERVSRSEVSRTTYRAAARKLALKDLPEAAQKTVQDQMKGGVIKSISKETENGVEQYEIETIWDGKHRDFNVDTKGNLLVVEEETSIAGIPAAASTRR